MRGRILAASAVVVILGVAVWCSSRQDDRAAHSARDALRLPSFDDRAVSAFTIDTPSASWRLARGAGGWRIVAPVDDAADAAAVEALLVAARRTPVLQAIDSAEAPATYGLDPPVARIAFEGVTATAIELGNVAPTGEGVFARLAGHPGVLILKLPEAGPLVAPDGQRLRDPALCDLTQSAITRVDLSPGRLRLERGEDGWWIEAPRRLPASAPQVDRLVGTIVGSKIVGVDDSGHISEARFGFGTDAVRITLRSVTDSREIALGGPAEGGRRYATREGRGTILLVDAAPLANLPLELDALRSTTLTNVNRYRVREIVYASGAKRFDAKRADDASWTTGSGATVPASDVYALLVGLLEAPTSSWSVRDEAGRPTAVLDYITVAGAPGRVSFFGDRAVWSAAPRVSFRLVSPPPPVPTR